MNPLDYLAKYPGPWRVDCCAATRRLILSTDHSGREHLMIPTRWGTQGASILVRDNGMPSFLAPIHTQYEPVWVGPLVAAVSLVSGIWVAGFLTVESSDLLFGMTILVLKEARHQGALSNWFELPQGQYGSHPTIPNDSKSTRSPRLTQAGNSLPPD